MLKDGEVSLHCTLSWLWRAVWVSKSFSSWSRALFDRVYRLKCILVFLIVVLSTGEWHGDRFPCVSICQKIFWLRLSASNWNLDIIFELTVSFLGLVSTIDNCVTDNSVQAMIRFHYVRMLQSDIWASFSNKIFDVLPSHVIWKLAHRLAGIQVVRNTLTPAKNKA